MRGSSGVDLAVDQRNRADEFHRRFNHVSTSAIASVAMTIVTDSKSDTTSLVSRNTSAVDCSRNPVSQHIPVNSLEDSTGRASLPREQSLLVGSMRIEWHGFSFVRSPLTWPLPRRRGRGIRRKTSYQGQDLLESSLKADLQLQELQLTGSNEPETVIRLTCRTGSATIPN